VDDGGITKADVNCGRAVDALRAAWGAGPYATVLNQFLLRLRIRACHSTPSYSPSIQKHVSVWVGTFRLPDYAAAFTEAVDQIGTNACEVQRVYPPTVWGKPIRNTGPQALSVTRRKPLKRTGSAAGSRSVHCSATGPNDNRARGCRPLVQRESRPRHRWVARRDRR
jgi:hypothetical protein